MNATSETNQPIDCPVLHCEGRPSDHLDADNSQNLHTVTGPELEAVSMSIDYVMMAASRGRWVLDVDTWHEMTETPPMAASLMALHLSHAAVRCIEMNNERLAGAAE